MRTKLLLLPAIPLAVLTAMQLRGHEPAPTPPPPVAPPPRVRVSAPEPPALPPLPVGPQAGVDA